MKHALVRQVLYANDAALVAHSKYHLRHVCNHVFDA